MYSPFSGTGLENAALVSYFTALNVLIMEMESNMLAMVGEQEEQSLRITSLKNYSFPWAAMRPFIFSEAL